MRLLELPIAVWSALCLATPVSLLCLPIAQRRVQADVAVVAFGLYGDQSMFESEVNVRSFRQQRCHRVRQCKEPR
jgi:hypothetical protein